jgi:nucleotide-binding universal stress UspA family protein
MIRIANVLVGTDFGEVSEAALAYGRELARTFGARLHVLHVIENPLVHASSEAVGVDFARVQADLEAEARAALNRLVSAEDREHLRAVATIRMDNSPAHEIVSYAKDADIDVIVVGTHGRSFMSRLLMGSVAQKVVRTAPCPVLTVHHPEHEFIVPDEVPLAERARPL